MNALILGVFIPFIIFVVIASFVIIMKITAKAASWFLDHYFPRLSYSEQDSIIFGVCAITCSSLILGTFGFLVDIGVVTP